jgi:hypothetical protein
MFEYEAHKELFDFLGLEENLIMHWTNLASWAMAEHMHALSWRAPNVLLEQCNSFHLLVMKLIPSTIKANFQFMLMWFKIGYGYQSFFPLSVWCWDQVLITSFKSSCKP